MQREINLERFITLRYADPICAIDLTDKYLLYGTMLGTAACYLINQKKLITLSETQDEHISGVKIQENKDNQRDNKFFVCVGDEKMFIYNSINENDNEIPKYSEIKNYDNENDHFQKCEKCFTMLKNDYLVRTFIEFPIDTKTDSSFYDTPISIKNINNLSEEKKATIRTTNYCVPFDFDGKNYIFIDFLEEKKRDLKIYNFDDNNLRTIEIYKFKEMGHISLLKILKNDLIFLVRKYNICEIRDLDFNLKRYFNYSGNEILAFDVMYTDENDFETLKIIVVDLNCNVISYNYKTNKEEYLFNLYDLKIEQVIKDQRFFSMGYPYYIKMSKQYLAISSDYGCLLIQHSPF